MSLRHQINLRILLLSLGFLLLGGGLTIWQARQTVDKEIEASTQLALQLITLGLYQHPMIDHSRDWSHIKGLPQTRHLDIQLQTASGERIRLAGEHPVDNSRNQPPDWFIQAVKKDYPAIEQRIDSESSDAVTVLIQPQPIDEIREVWDESLTFFLSIALLSLVIFVTINLLFDKALKAISLIVQALQSIEAGHYRLQLPRFASREFDDIANAINHMAAKLEKTGRENRALAQHSLAIQEEERRRLSQELHDELGQSLTAIKVMAVTAGHRQADSGKVTASIAELCDHLMMVVRSMMQQLQPLMLTELGLKATLEDLVGLWAERNPELILHLACDPAVDNLDKTIAAQVFRIIQECLTNIVRHASANRSEIALHITDHPAPLLRLSVIDDGQGCDLQNSGQGFGLLGIKERVRSLDGQLKLQSAPGRGMHILVTIPL